MQNPGNMPALLAQASAPTEIKSPFSGDRRMNLGTRLLGVASLTAACFLLGATTMGRAQGNPGIRGFAPSRVEAERGLEQHLRTIPDAQHAEANLRRLTTEPHMAGTEASHRVAEWLRDQYQSFGFDAEIVTYTALLSYPREIQLELTAPENKPLATPEQPVDLDKDTFDARAVGAFNAYSPSGEATAPVVYVNYGTPEDYRELDSLGVSLEGKIALARYGRNYRGIKAKLAEEHKAAALLIFSDPQDDGYVQGDPYPRGPWRNMSGIQRGSILYTEMYPGDPLTPGIAATPGAKRLAPADAVSLPHIPTLPINAQDASAILAHLSGQHVPHGWQGGLPLTYHIGPGDAEVHLRVAMDYQQRPLYDVIARLRGATDDEWVVMGNHHDAWVFGAVDPNSGTASMLEAARALGELARTGWKPRRTIVLCEWDGEEPGLIGSTEWVEANRAELQAKAVAYVNSDIGVSGPNFGASAVPSLKGFLREVTHEVQDPRTGRTVYEAWRERVAHAREQSSGTGRREPPPDPSGDVPVGALGAGSDFCPFLDHAGIPSIDVGFGGDYGVYHSLYDDFFWMKHFGDPTFVYHAALARILGTIALRLSEADLLPFDYSVYASDIARAADDLSARSTSSGAVSDINIKVVTDAAGQLSAAASRASAALQSLSSVPVDPARALKINRALAGVEQAFLAPEGLSGRPWYKHTIYAPGSYAGYAAGVMPGVSEALDRHDPATLTREEDALAAALRRAAARLDEITRLAVTPAKGGK
jgi:N-acetylated-alpha-linked acidic dipeptidase